MEPKKVIPKNFLWGASTASHQVDGGSHNQWTVWELANAKRLAKTAHQRLGYLPNWAEIKEEAEDPENYVSGKGVDHYRRYKEDFDLIKKLNLNSFRFGVEWARLEAQEDSWDDDEWQHYREYIDELNKRGITPVLNIWHWTVPTWFANKGGFLRKENLTHFDKFVEKVCLELDLSKCKYVITLNEPNVYASFGYITGEWPPNEKKWMDFLKVYWNLTRVHRRAYKIIKSHYPSVQVGIATQLANIQAKRPHNLLDYLGTKWMRFFWNWWFINKLKGYQDFIGFNYYFTDYYRLAKRDNPKLPLNDLGWYMEPEGLYPLILRVWARYKLPILITENGVADSNDQHRRWWLTESMLAVERALSEGVELRGYFYWSLLDNFEWAYGWWPKFGLIAVDRKNGMKRTIRPSAKWWAEQLKKLQQ